MRQTVVVSLPDHDVSVLVAPVSACVTLETNEVAVLAGGRAIEVKMPVGEATVLGESPPIDVGIADGTITVVCDNIIAPSFATPTLVSWSISTADHEDSGVDIATSSVTAGTPCRVRFHLVAAVGFVFTPYSAPDQTSPHATSMPPAKWITSPLLRGKTCDLYWYWTSGMSSGSGLVSAAAIYIPLNGEGDFAESG